MEDLLTLNPRSPTGRETVPRRHKPLTNESLKRGPRKIIDFWGALWARVKRRNGGRLNSQSGFFATSQFRRYGRNNHLHRPCGKSIGQDLRQEKSIRSGNPQERQSQERLRSHWTTLYTCVSSRAQSPYQVRASMRRYSHAYAQSFAIYDRQSGIRSSERPVQQPLALRLHPSVERV